jgi:hypothetical protein
MFGQKIQGKVSYGKVLEDNTFKVKGYTRDKSKGNSWYGKASKVNACNGKACKDNACKDNVCKGNACKGNELNGMEWNVREMHIRAGFICGGDITACLRQCMIYDREKQNPAL